jgi:hypothetical protein
MAGSRRDFDYVADDAALYGINADESNVELCNLTGTGAPTAVRRAPRNLKQLRSWVLEDATKQIRRIVPILSAARFNALSGGASFVLPANDVDVGTTVFLVQKIPEKFTRLIQTVDTGKLDGDNP